MGKRYIDADALKDKARELLPFTQNDAVWAVYNFWDLFDGIIDNAPTADVVEVVRCKDCKHNPKYEWFTCPAAGLNEKQRPETAWCWKGERREDEALCD